ncbi:MAG: Hint domain-containing protein [Pseudomonadota bacterium]
MPFLDIQSWSQFTTPPGLPVNDLRFDTNPNDPASPEYRSDQPSWIGQTFTFNGGAPIEIEIADDDTLFEDGYVETGTRQTLAQDVTIDGRLYTAGSFVENEFSLDDASGRDVYIVRIDGRNVGFAYGDGTPPAPGDTYTATQGFDGDPTENADGTSSSTTPYASIMCYGIGTMIETPTGPCPVEALEVGQDVMSLDRGPVPVIWVRRMEQVLSGLDLDDRPVLVTAGALGPGRPARDLVVSPQHRILIGGAQLPSIVARPAFAPAKALTGLPGIRHLRGPARVSWVHFACARHEVILAEGCESESLLLGPMVRRSLTQADRARLSLAFGRPVSMEFDLNGPPARPCLTVAEVRSAVRTARHLEWRRGGTECPGDRRVA